MQENPFGKMHAPTSYPTLERMNGHMHHILAEFVHGGTGDPATRTARVSTLLLSLWQLAGRGMTHRVPSLVMINTHGEGPGPLDALAASLVNPLEDTGPRPHKQGAFAHGTPQMAPAAMTESILRLKERRQHAALPWVPSEIQAWEDHFFAAQATGFGYGPTRPYAAAWHDSFGLMSERSCQVILRLESDDDRAAFREQVVTDPQRLLAAIGYGPGLELISKRLSVSGALTPTQWDREFADRAVALGMPVLFLPGPICKPDTASIQDALNFMTAMFPKAFKDALEEPAYLFPGEWFAHYGEQLRTRLRTLPHHYDYAMQRMARQLFPVCRRLATWAGRLSGATTREMEALALDLCGHALRGLVVSVAGLAWHVLGFDPGCERAKALKTLAYMRTRGSMTLSDLVSKARLTKAERNILVERFAAENLVRVNGKFITATTYKEFVSSLYARKEFPTPVNYWEQVAKTAAPAA